MRSPVGRTCPHGRVGLVVEPLGSHPWDRRDVGSSYDILGKGCLISTGDIPIGSSHYHQFLDWYWLIHQLVSRRSFLGPLDLSFPLCNFDGVRHGGVAWWRAGYAVVRPCWLLCVPLCTTFLSVLQRPTRPCASVVERSRSIKAPSLGSWRRVGATLFPV